MDFNDRRRVIPRVFRHAEHDLRRREFHLGRICRFYGVKLTRRGKLFRFGKHFERLGPMPLKGHTPRSREDSSWQTA
jgi:hypothetical protein